MGFMQGEAMFSEATPEGFSGMLSPGEVDSKVKDAIWFCWMGAPNDKKTVAYVEVEIRRIVERALKNLREDAKSFGIGEQK
jgi:hypothetical protein